MTEFFAVCPRGLEDLLANELRAIGADRTRASRGGTYFEGKLETAYRAVLWSRLANGILHPLKTFRAATEKELYKGVRSISWDDHFGVDDTFAVTFKSTRSQLTHTHYGTLKAKDAIVDQFRDAMNRRPSIDTDSPDIRINVFIDKDIATVAIDLAGESLHRRGYRVAKVEAPLKENVAAAVLTRAGWANLAEEGRPFIDPFCGSGTLAIEAAMMAGDIAPGLLRNRHGFEGWLGHVPKIWSRLIEEAEERRELGMTKIPAIYAYDNDAKAARAARKNASAAGLHRHVMVDMADVSKLTPPASEMPGLICTNPPYGERISEDDAFEIHHEFGERMIHHFMGWKAAVLTGSKELGFELGVRAKKATRMDNGPIEAVLLLLDIEERRVLRERRPADWADA